MQISKPADKDHTIEIRFLKPLNLEPDIRIY